MVLSETQRQDLTEALWAHMKCTMGGLCMCCNDCGDFNASWCPCAKAKFMATVSDEELEKFMADLAKKSEIPSS
jgi:hypothetical protein